jgi:hypothetical protein
VDEVKRGTGGLMEDRLSLHVVYMIY